MKIRNNLCPLPGAYQGHETFAHIHSNENDQGDVSKCTGFRDRHLQDGALQLSGSKNRGRTR